MFILDLYLTTQITGIDIVIELKNSKIRKIPGHSGSSLCEAVLLVNIYTGCHCTGRYNTE